MSKHDGEEPEPDGAEASAEDRLIATYFRPIATHPGAFDLADDAAAIAPPPGCDLVLKTDGVISGVHFFLEDPADAVARKALRINLSDLAAKGAAPLGFLLSIGLPAGLPPDWLKAFACGLRQDAEHYGCPLLGGDTDRSPGAITVYIAALGTVPHGAMVRRKGARPGDLVVATGTIGDAALGLVLRQDAAAAGRWKLDDAMRDHLLGRYLLPQPRNAIAEALRRHASAAMDVSDGLAGDLAKLCRVSGVAADVAVGNVPLSPAARAGGRGGAGADRDHPDRRRRFRGHRHRRARQVRGVAPRGRRGGRGGDADRHRGGRAGGEVSRP